MNQGDEASTVISGAWIDALRAFASGTRSRLLIASPWVKYSVAQLVFACLPPVPRPEVYLLARLELEDFLSGASDLEVFNLPNDRAARNFHVRALRNLHAKFLISDEWGLILGSANLTEGGLYRNQEALIMSREPTLVRAAQSLFWDWWRRAAEVGESYFSWVQEQLLSLTPPDAEESPPKQHAGATRARTAAQRPPVSIPWIAPPGGAEVAKQLNAVRQSTNAFADLAQVRNSEDTEQVLAWLERHSKWVPSAERRSPEFVELLSGYIRHVDPNVRAKAVDRVGRLRVTALQPTLRKFLADEGELPGVRAASAFALTLLADPGSFGDLVQASNQHGFIGRWARRGCFMLLSRIDPEQRQWFLYSLGIQPSAELDRLVFQVRADTGTNSERLAKALVLEMLVREEWNETCLDLLTSAVFKLGERLSGSRQKIRGYGEFVKATASLLRVTPGDLRHGILAISFVRRVWDSGWPNGLLELFGSRSTSLKGDVDAFTSHLGSSADLKALTEALSK